ncbi:hypothetical protein, partial [Frankia sp. CiP3]|uniref:hypothetical protein n=1 Tax=Frankia sp. CiP3 TaxID=2880971 RepID=UPI001EF5FBC0
MEIATEIVPERVAQADDRTCHKGRTKSHPRRRPPPASDRHSESSACGYPRAWLPAAVRATGN